jgi:hypothetical protein
MVSDPHNHTHPVGHTPDMHDPPDEWHRHTTAEERPQHAHGELANPGRVMAAGFLAFVIVIIATLAVYLYYLSYTIHQLDLAEQHGLEAEVLRARQDANDRLQRGYVWADESKGFVQLPIETARRRVIDQYVSHYRSGSASQNPQ